MLEELYKKYRHVAEFFVVYIREAHPRDGWAVPPNVHSGISIPDPRTYAERVKVAENACTALRISIPCLVDDMSDSVNKAYSAWPDRLYVIDSQGKLAVAGGHGPFGFAPSIGEASLWLKEKAVSCYR